MLAIATAACGTANPSLNTQLPVLQQSVDDLLAKDDIADATRIARGLERRLPGIDTYALLGRVTWRAGDLVEAEALFRRAATGGAPEGVLGFARSRAARLDLDAAAGIVGDLVSVGPVGARAHRLLAALAWAHGRVADAAQQLAAAADLSDNPRRERDRAEAEVLQGIASVDPDDPLGWTGRGAVVALEPTDMTFAGTVDGRPARLSIALTEDRTAVAPHVLADSEQDARASVPVRAVALGFGTLTATHVPVEVRDLAEGIDARIGFDVLSTLTWALDENAARLELSAVGEASRKEGEPPRAPYLPDTYWAMVRIPRDGLAVQLLLVPRIRARVLTAAVDPGGADRIDERVFPDALDDRDGGLLAAELRLGAWRQKGAWELTDLFPMGDDGAVAPQAVLGSSAFAGWRLYWTPGARSLVLERLHGEPGLQ